MPKQYTRSEYLRLKSIYNPFHTLLIIFRGVGLLTIIAFIVLTIVYTMNGAAFSNKESFLLLMDVLRVTILVIIGFWIATKIVVVMFLRKLRYIKRKLDITDEI